VQAQARPLYNVAERLNFPAPQANDELQRASSLPLPAPNADAFLPTQAAAATLAIASQAPHETVASTSSSAASSAILSSEPGTMSSPRATLAKGTS